MVPTEFPALAALILHPEIGPILFDTGYASHFHHSTSTFPERLYRWVTPVDQPQNQTLAAQLGRFGIAPSDIRVCVISHFHADHIAGVRDLQNARFISTGAEYAQMKGASRIRGLMQGLLPSLLPPDFSSRIDFAEHTSKLLLKKPWSAFGEGFDLLGDGSVVGIALPGHSAGQMGVLLKDETGRDVFLCADACWSQKTFRDLCMPSFLARPLMHSWANYCETIEHIHVLAEQHTELVVLPSHCNESLAAYQKAWSVQ